MPLSNNIPKTIHQLRAQCQANGINFEFSDDALALASKLQTVEDVTAVKDRPEAIYPVVEPKHAATDEERILQWLDAHIQHGLNVDFSCKGAWRMTFGKKEDTGSLKMPMRHILAAADRMLR